MKHLFWILCAAEIFFLFWMLWDEMKLKHLAMPAYIPMGFIWLLLAIIVKLVVKSDKVALLMVGIPGVPPMIMAIFLLIVYVINLVSGPIRWN